MGLVVSFTHQKSSRSASPANFLLTLMVLPVVICVIIMLVGSNVARAFSLAGAFTLVRFRSEPGDPKDIAYICIVMAVGLSTGMGFLTYAVMVTLILCTVLMLFGAATGWGMERRRWLKIDIPEDLNYYGAFDDILEEYTAKSTLDKVRTTDMGSIFQLSYTVRLKEARCEKEFIDALRCRNGNLSVALLMCPQ